MPNNQKNQTNQNPQKQAEQNAPSRTQDPAANQHRGGDRGMGNVKDDQREPRKGQVQTDADNDDDTKVNSNR